MFGKPGVQLEVSRSQGLPDVVGAKTVGVVSNPDTATPLDLTARVCRSLRVTPTVVDVTAVVVGVVDAAVVVVDDAVDDGAALGVAAVRPGQLGLLDFEMERIHPLELQV